MVSSAFPSLCLWLPHQETPQYHGGAGATVPSQVWPDVVPETPIRNEHEESLLEACTFHLFRD
jgi:hypothetical protein